MGCLFPWNKSGTKAFRRGSYSTRRFDVAQIIDYPTINAQKYYVEAKLKNREKTAEVVNEALSEYEKERKKGQNVTFSYLDELAEEACSIEEKEITKEKVLSLLRSKVNRKGPRCLVG